MSLDQDGNESVMSMSTVASSASAATETKLQHSAPPMMEISKEFRKEAEDAFKNADVRSILGLHRATTCAHCGTQCQKAAAAAAKKTKDKSAAAAAAQKQKKHAAKTKVLAAKKKGVKVKPAPGVGAGGIPYCTPFGAKDYLRLYASQYGKCKCCAHTLLRLPNVSLAKQPIATGHLVILNDKYRPSASSSSSSGSSASGSGSGGKEAKETKDPAAASASETLAPTAATAASDAIVIKETLNCKTKKNVKYLVCAACIQIVRGCANKPELLNKVRQSWFQAAAEGTIKNVSKTPEGDLIVHSRYWPRLDKLPFEQERPDGKLYASIDTPSLPKDFGKKKQPLYQKWLEQQGCVAYPLPPRLQGAMADERNRLLEARRARIAAYRAQVAAKAGAGAGAGSEQSTVPLGRQEDHPNRVFADGMPEDELVLARTNKRKPAKGGKKAKGKETTSDGKSGGDETKSAAAGNDDDESSHHEEDNNSDDQEDDDADEVEDEDVLDNANEYEMPVIDSACWIEPDKLMERRQDIIQFMIPIDPRACAARNGTLTSLAFTPADRTRAMGATNFLLTNRQLDKIEKSFDFDDFMNWATKVLIRHVRPVFCFDMNAATKANHDFAQRGKTVAHQLNELYDREEQLVAAMKPQMDVLKKTRKIRTQVQNSYSDFLIKAVESDVSLSFLNEYKLGITRSGVSKRTIASKAGTAAKVAAPLSIDAKIVRELLSKSLSDQTRALYNPDELARAEAVEQFMKDAFKFQRQLVVARSANSKANDQPRFRVRRLKKPAGKRGRPAGGGNMKKGSVKASVATSTTSAESAAGAGAAAAAAAGAKEVSAGADADADVSASASAATPSQTTPVVKKRGAKRKREVQEDGGATPVDDGASVAASSQQEDDGSSRAPKAKRARTEGPSAS